MPVLTYFSYKSMGKSYKSFISTTRFLCHRKAISICGLCQIFQHPTFIEGISLYKQEVLCKHPMEPSKRTHRACEGIVWIIYNRDSRITLSIRFKQIGAISCDDIYTLII